MVETGQFKIHRKSERVTALKLEISLYRDHGERYACRFNLNHVEKQQPLKYGMCCCALCF